MFETDESAGDGAIGSAGNGEAMYFDSEGALYAPRPSTAATVSNHASELQLPTSSLPQGSANGAGSNGTASKSAKGTARAAASAAELAELREENETLKQRLQSVKDAAADALGEMEDLRGQLAAERLAAETAASQVRHWLQKGRCSNSQAACATAACPQLCVHA